MQKNVEEAFAMFSDDKPLGLFAYKLPHNLKCVNDLFDSISTLFANAGVTKFETLPEQVEEKAQFARLFRSLCGFINAAKLQGFSWNTQTYPYVDSDNNNTSITVNIDEETFAILMLRYKELFGSSGITPPADTPFDLDGSLTEIDTGKIDYDYMNTRFVKFLVALTNGDPSEIENVRSLITEGSGIISTKLKRLLLQSLHIAPVLPLFKLSMLLLTGYHMTAYILTIFMSL